MKKFINRAEHAVEEMLQGLTILSPGSDRLPGHRVLLRADAEQIRDKQVAIISGGGSGHEPAHAGYVGAGMLTAAVAGEIFTSPDTDSIFETIIAIAGKPGVLLVVKNYTGDRLNFGLAVEMARSEGIAVETIIVDDDVALSGTDSATGARGLAGTVLVHKLVGAAASEGRTLTEIAALGRSIVRSLGTMGVSFSAGISPAVGKPSFELAEDEMELGLGIHGEPGVIRTKLQSADQLTETLLTQILKSRNFGTEVAVLINNLGATTEMELAIVARHAADFLRKNRFTIERLYAGTFLSSLDMAGISISVMGVDEERLRWLDAPTNAPAWPNVPRERPRSLLASVPLPKNSKASTHQRNHENRLVNSIKKAIEAACDSLIQAEPKLTELDRIAGDGDLGASMKRASIAVLKALPSYSLNDLPMTLKELGQTLRHELGGSSGPLYGVLFLRVANVLEHSSTIGLSRWATALDEGARAISELGGAKSGDRTMLDALDPFVKALERAGAGSAREILLDAAEAAQRGAESTAQMKPRLGRSSYLGDRVIGYPDPGAIAIAIWLRAMVDVVIAGQKATNGLPIE
jgi:dihydroxyacetone kinase, phosphoprotein-dependent, L subunit